MKYLIWSVEHQGWWAVARCGYVDNPLEAGVYDENEANDICRDANIACGEGVVEEIMIPAHKVLNFAPKL